MNIDKLRIETDQKKKKKKKKKENEAVGTRMVKSKSTICSR